MQRALATSSNHLSKGQGYTSPLGCPTQVTVAMTGQFQQRGFFCFVRVGMITYITKDSPCNSDVPSWQYVLKSMTRSAYFCKLGTEASAFKTWLFRAEGFKMILFSSLPSFQRRSRSRAVFPDREAVQNGREGPASGHQSWTPTSCHVLPPLCASVSTPAK